MLILVWVYMHMGVGILMVYVCFDDVFMHFIMEALL